MGNGKSENDADGNSAGDFEGFHSLCRTAAHVIHNEIIRCIINACARDKRKNACDKIERNGIFTQRGKKTGEDCQKKRGIQ